MAVDPSVKPRNENRIETDVLFSLFMNALTAMVFIITIIIVITTCVYIIAGSFAVIISGFEPTNGWYSNNLKQELFILTVLISRILI